jgi:hypothetical protein
MARTFFMALVASVTLAAAVSAQTSRAYIREQIERWGSCRTVAITKTNGDLAIYGSNGWASSGIPKGLENKIRSLNADGEYIRDVVLTEGGRWLILYGDNGYSWDGIPDGDPLLTKLREYNKQRQRITSVTFNDYGDWAVVTTNYFSASDNELMALLKECNEKFGQIWTVCFSDDGAVAVFEDGFRYRGNVPQNLKNALSRTDLDVYTLKIAGASWFFADADGNYDYTM